MDRYAAVAIALLAGVALAAPSASKKKPVALHLRALDAAKRRATVELSGVSRSPAPNLFTFTDERGRHFVAVAARCEERDEGARVCELEIPPGYEKHPLKALALHLHGLHGRTVEVPADEIAAAAAAAAAAAPPAAPPLAAPDGGTP
jgi:hypothetical protein